MDDQTNKFLIPGAIAFAGIIVAVAVIYSLNGTPSYKDKSKNEATATISMPAVTSTDFVLGDQNAPVTIVEYGDFQCPFCGKFFKETEPVIRENYIKTGKVKFIYRDFAFLGQESFWAANAARCAGEQSKFWEYHDYIYSNQRGENQGAFSKNNLKSFAASLNLDREKFNTCLDSDKYLEEIKKETKAGADAGVQGTPANFINGKINIGALPTTTFIQIIDNELNK